MPRRCRKRKRRGRQKEGAEGRKEIQKAKQGIDGGRETVKEMIYRKQKRTGSK